MKRLAYLFLTVQLYSIKCQKNVVLIIADDFRPNVGVMEDSNHFSSPEMITPNLDKLAERSLVLTKAYTQISLCGPSRSSFLTGRRPDSIQCYDNNHKVRVNRPNIVTMPQYFKENGYQSLATGKIFHPGIPNNNNNDDYPQSWTHKIFHTATTDNSSVSWYAYTEEELESQNITLRDVANVDHFIETLNKPSTINNQPFFYAVGLHKPHMPWDAPKEFFDLYPEADEIDLPNNPYVPEDMPDAAWTGFKGVLGFEDCSPEGTGIPDIGQPNVTYPDPQIRKMRRAYYASISFMDHLVGRVIKGLEDAGVADHTAIMFIGDHGLHMGEHSAWDKYTNFDLAHRAPMMLHVPGVIEQSMFSENLVEFVDILPTLVEAAGLPSLEKCPENSRDVPICREGTSLLRIVDETQPWKEAVFWQQPRDYWNTWNVSHHYQGYTVRTPQYRYSEYVRLQDPDLMTQEPDWDSPVGWGELYDLFEDPDETKNLYREQEMHDTKLMLRKILYAGWSEYN